LITTLLQYLAGALIGYLLGAFPTGYFVGRLWRVDVRKHGSGRTGGTNVLRTAGWGAFALTVLGDLSKGIIAVLMVRFLFPPLHGAHALAVLGVLIGHNWSIWIALLAKSDPRAIYARPPLGWIQRLAQQGRGGAGVGVTVGAVATLFPPVLVLAPIPLAVLLIWRYASVGSMTVAVLFPFEMFYFCANGYAPWSYFALAVVVCVIIFLVHIPNIKRLRAGTEKHFGERLGRKPRQSTPEDA
jgi:acyl phosphate:glycerol-3-phosphate acyltransferase